MFIKRDTDAYGKKFWDIPLLNIRRKKKTVTAIQDDMNLLDTISRTGKSNRGNYYQAYINNRDQFSEYARSRMEALPTENFNKNFSTNSKQVQAELSSLQQNAIKTQGAFSGLGSALKSIGGNIAASLINMAITWALTKAIEFLDQLARREEIAIEKTKELQEQWGELNSETKDNKSFVDENGERYEELSKGVDTTTNQNISLSTDEYKEYLSLTNAIADQFPDLISGYDAEGNAILNVQGSLAKLNDEYERLAQQSRDQIITDAADVLKGARLELRGGIYCWHAHQN